MAADSREIRTAQARQACITCKTRKKKCNKALPACGYCIRKRLDCAYAAVTRHQDRAAFNPEKLHAASTWVTPPSSSGVTSRVIPSAKSLSEPTTGSHDAQVYLEVHNAIRATGQFVDDIIYRYFQSFHRQLPIISRTRFSNNLVNLGAAPTADFSVLLLTLCLITHAPALGYQARQEASQSVEQQSLYLTVRSLFAQVQVSCSPSVPLVQTGLLLAVYEYTHGRPNDAFVTIAGSARIAYAARIHTSGQQVSQSRQMTMHNADIDQLSQTEEAANTWWGMLVYERIFFNELTVLDQPFVTVFPSGDARLPLESQVLDQLDISDPGLIPNIPMCGVTSSKIGGFGRTAQATCLLDKVLSGINTPDIDSRLLLLDSLDINIRGFLSQVMPQCQGQTGTFCASMNIAIRALFTLHEHVLSQDSQVVKTKFKPLEEWQKASREALDTVTKMVTDIADTLIIPSSANATTRLIDGMPPMYPYIAYAGLRHIQNSTQRGKTDWLRSAEGVIQTSLDRWFERWSVSGH